MGVEYRQSSRNVAENLKVKMKIASKIDKMPMHKIRFCQHFKIYDKAKVCNPQMFTSFYEKLVNYLESCENLLRFFFSETQFVVEVCTLKNSHHYFCLCREPPSITEQLVVKCHGARRSSSIQMLMDGTSAPFHTYHPAFLLVSFHFNRAQGPPPPALHTIPCQLLRRHCHK